MSGNQSHLIQLLQRTGMTQAESKVYLSLRRHPDATTGTLIEDAKVSASKIYALLEKLQRKGLVSYYLKNNIKHYRAAEPERIHDYLENQKEQINETQQEIMQAAGQLTPRIKKPPSNAEIFTGWNGLETVYTIIQETLEKGDDNYVIGASSGSDERRTANFFIRHVQKLLAKNVAYNILFNESARGYVAHVEEKGGFTYNSKRFLTITTPVEINIFRTNVALVRLTEQPLVVLIRDEKTAESFLQYYHALLQISSE